MGEIVSDKFGLGTQPHRRRVRYSGKNPRQFAEKYKEHNPARYGEIVSKVQASGKTPAGTHRPIMVKEVLQILGPKPGEVVVDCTLGFGGHAREILSRIVPGGLLIGLDADPIELPKTEARLRALGFGDASFQAIRSNFAGLPKAMAALDIPVVDAVFADLGVSSMQLDDPARGFLQGITSVLDVQGSANLSLAADALVHLNLGLDFTTPTSPPLWMY